MFNAEILRSELHYDESTGVFTRLKTGFGKRAGQVAGTLKTDGYISIGIAGKLTYAHRLAWLYVYGELPKYEIDHINGCRSDNRIVNLRDVPPKINCQNHRNASRNNASGYLGVCWDKQALKWKANITVAGKLKHLGFAATPEAAHAIYVSAKRQFHEGNTL